MAKRLLLNVLVKVLGEFIELNEENLNLAVWSGQIVLTNLTLKTEHILKNFNLNVFHGSIQRLEVTIPWATLLINPVKIVIDGILLDVGPLDIAKLGKVEALKRYMAEKLQKLKMVDQYLELSLNLKPEETSPTNNNPNSETYIQQWTTKIIDNIEIRVTDMHIRYEDSLSMPGKVFACGLTLNSFGISTSDSNWAIGAARKTGANADPGAVYKLAYLKCLGIYWQVEAASLASMPLKEWENVMMQYIVKEDWTLPGASREAAAAPRTGVALGDGGMQMLLARAQSKQLILQQSNSQTKEYILSPYNNSLTLKLKQNKKPTQTAPKFDICAESSNLQIHLDSLQYVELFSVVDRLGALGRMFKPRTYRPNERPYNRRTSITWWKYACKLAIRSRKYVDLVKLSLRLAAGREDPHEYLPPYAAAEVRYLEERLPFEPLRVGRQRAMLELQEEAKQAQKMQSRPALDRQQGTWWGSWSNGSGNTPVKPAGAPLL
jgi:vacuolar protein sorting-associated protein 13A/C